MSNLARLSVLIKYKTTTGAGLSWDGATHRKEGSTTVNRASPTKVATSAVAELARMLAIDGLPEAELLKEVTGAYKRVADWNAKHLKG